MKRPKSEDVHKIKEKSLSWELLEESSIPNVNIKLKNKLKKKCFWVFNTDLIENIIFF